MDPALTWLEPALGACAATQSGLAVLRSDGDPTSDLAFHFGPPADESGFSAVIGDEELLIAVHPANPVETLSVAEVERIFTSEAVSWQAFLPESDGESAASTEPVEALVYPEDSILSEAFLSALPGMDRLDASHPMIPSPAAMRVEIASRPGAIGVLPARWLDDTIKPITLSDLENPDVLRLPVVAVASSEPQGAVRDWLLCVQDILQP